MARMLAALADRVEKRSIRSSPARVKTRGISSSLGQGPGGPLNANLFKLVTESNAREITP
jgi:hypothetical protein